MKMMLGIILLFNFYNLIFVMELPKHHVSQEEYDAAYFPISKEQKKILEQARLQQMINPQDNQARQTLAKLATDIDKPCVQAMRELAGIATRQYAEAIKNDDPDELKKKNNLLDALYWSNMGARAYDPVSAFCAASLLQASDSMPLDPEVYNRSLQNLLRYAASNHRMPPTSDKKYSYFSQPLAREQLNDFLYRKQYEFEEKIDKHFLGLLPQLEQDGLDRYHLPTGCFFINKFVYGDQERGIEPMPVRALEWTETLLESPGFDPLYFNASGAHDALMQLTNPLQPMEIQQRAHHLLNHIGFAQMHVLDQSGLVFNCMQNNDSDVQKTSKQKKQKKREQTSIQQFKTAFEQGDVGAGWALLAHEPPHEGTPQLLNSVIQATNSANINIARSASSIYQALHHLEKQTSNEALQANLGLLYLNGFKFTNGIEELLTADENKAFDLLKNGGAQGIEILIDHTSKIYDPTVCLKAARFLLDKKESSSDAIKNKLSTALFTYLDRSLMLSSSAEKKEIIKECFSESRYLYPYAIKAMHEFCTCLAKEQSPTQEDLTFANVYFAQFSNRVDRPEPDTAAAVLLYDLLKESPALFNFEAGIDKDRLALLYLDRAGQKGDFAALRKMIPLFKDRTPTSSQDYKKTMRFWTTTLVIASELSESDAPAIRDVAVAQINKLDTEKIDSNITTHDDAVYYYYLMIALAKMGADQQRIFNAFTRAESIVHAAPDLERLLIFAKSGAKVCMQRLAKEGQGWASYALALHDFKQYSAMVALGREYLGNPDVSKDIEQLEGCRNLLIAARTAPHPHTNFSEFSEMCIDRQIGYEYKKMAMQKSPQAAYWMQKALAHFDIAAQQGDKEALFEWAHICLTNYGCVGEAQAILTKAIDRLIHALQLGHMKARDALQKIDEQGFKYLPFCGGTITAQLQRQIFDALKQHQPAAAKEVIVAAAQVPSPSAEQPLSRLEQALAFFKNPQTQQKAHELFMQEAALENPEAYVYLGIMHRDGLCEQASAQKAGEYFKKAMLTNQLDAEHVRILNQAYEATKQSAQTDIGIQAARVKFLLGSYLLYKKEDNNLLNEQQIQSVCADIVKDIELFEKQALKDSVAARNAFYSDGLLERMIEVSKLEENLPLLCEITRVCGNRINENAQQSADQVSSTALKVPFVRLQELLEKRIYYEDKSHPVFNDCNDQTIMALIAMLKQNIERKDLIDRNQSEFLLGLLLVNGSIESKKWASMKEGLAYLNNACKCDYDPATYALGVLKIMGHKLIPTPFDILKSRGNTITLDHLSTLNIMGHISNPLPKDENNGIALLEKLGKKGHEKALLTLAGLFMQRGHDVAKPKEKKKNFARAKEYYNQLLSFDPNNPEAAFGVGIFLFEDMQSVADDEKPEKYTDLFKLFRIASTSKKLTSQAMLYNVYLAITGFIKPCTDAIKESLAPKVILEQFEQILSACEKDDRLNSIFGELFNEDGLDILYKKWCENLEKQSEQKEYLSRAYCLYGWMNSLMARNSAHDSFTRLSQGKNIVQTAEYFRERFKTSKEYLDKSLTLPNIPLTTYCLLASHTLHSARAESDIRSLAEAKRHLVRASVLMQQKNLKFTDAPSFKMVLSNYQEFLIANESRLGDNYEKEMTYVETLIDKFTEKATEPKKESR